jgi:hypothetical protein
MAFEKLFCQDKILAHGGLPEFQAPRDFRFTYSAPAKIVTLCWQ